MGKVGVFSPRMIKNIVEKFYQSRDAALYKLKGINPELSIKVGNLQHWESLHQSIMSTGIVMWGKYIPASQKKGIRKILFSWQKVGLNRGAFLNKIYGFTVHGKKYQGLLEIVQGEKIGKSSILIPVHEREKFIVLFKKHNVNAKSQEVWA